MDSSLEIESASGNQQMCARNQQQTREKLSNSFIGLSEQLLMKRGQHDLLGVLHCNKLLMSTRPFAILFY